jgi:hypothetical protein
MQRYYDVWFIASWLVLSAPVGFADHKGRHKVGVEPVAFRAGEAPAAGIPANSKKLGLQI